jgi:hypothetical protein
MTNLKHRGSAQPFEKTLALKVAMDDALEGYDKMLEKAEATFKPTVAALLEQHNAARRDLDTLLRERGTAVDQDGSFMGAVHKTVVTLRSVVDDPDGDWIPGILDGEERNLGKYDDAIAETAREPALQAALTKHRDALRRAVESLRDRRRADIEVG